MKWLKRILIAFAALIAVLVAAAIAIPFFVSVDDYVPRMEKEASDKLKEPVKIGKIHLAGLPVPHVVIDAITVGKTGDLKVGKVTVTPELSSLFSATRVIRSIEIDSLVLTQKAIEKIPVWTKQDGKPDQPSPVRIGSLRLSDALVKLDKTSFGPFDARVTLDDKGQPGEASITTRDGKLKAVVTPENSKYTIIATARSWTLPAGPPIVFDELEIRGVATLTEADFSQVTAKLYGGTAVGKVAVGWQKGLQLKGNVDLAQIELANLVPIVSPGTNMSGRLNAKPVFSAAAADGSQLLAALHVETPFDVQHGVLHGVDIEKAAMKMIGKGGGGGETHFDRLAGHVVRDHLAYKFSGLKISSGVLAADGDVGISPHQDLSGRVNAKVNALGASATVALNVSGTVHSPSLMPTGGTIAGAAIGTAILPGIGTGVGAKAGQMIEGLFGKKPK
jgi:uncharacterized protein involved in outer membrane biogenesis